MEFNNPTNPAITFAWWTRSVRIKKQRLWHIKGAQRRHQRKVVWLRSWSLFTSICRPCAPTLPPKPASCEISQGARKEPAAARQMKTDWLLITHTHTQRRFKLAMFPPVWTVSPPVCQRSSLIQAGEVILWRPCCCYVVERTLKKKKKEQCSCCCITSNIDCERALSRSFRVMWHRGC